MKYKVGDRVMMRSLQWCKENIFNNEDKYPPEIFRGIEKFCGKILMISDAVDKSKYVDEGYYNMAEDTEWEYYWTDEMIEGLVEEEIIDIDDFQDDNEIIDVIDEYVHRLKNNECQINLPEGYQFTDENGNVINAQKIVLERKKPKYPTTYEECCKVLGVSEFEYNHTGTKVWYRHKLMATLDKLMLCRDAYWKLYGEEKGLGKPWEPDWNDEEQDKYGFHSEVKYTIINSAMFVFPTPEMRDAFKKNFDPDIEICKELL